MAAHRRLDWHNSARAITQIAQPGAHTGRRRLDIHPVLVVDWGPDVLLQVLRRDADVHCIRYLERLTLLSRDLPLARLLCLLLLWDCRLGSRRGTLGSVLLLDRLVFILSLLRNGNFFREGVLAQVLNELERRLAVNLTKI